MPARSTLRDEVAELARRREAVLEDLIESLEEVDRRATITLKRIATGGAVNGSSGLAKIHEQASDALDRARKQLEGKS